MTTARKASKPKTRPRKPASDLATLMRDNHKRFLGFLKTRLADEGAAEGVLQTAYAKGLQRAGALRDGEKVIAWFYRLLRNTLIDYYRHRAAENRAYERLSSEADHRREAVDRDLERTVCRCVGALVKTLKPEYADIIRMAEIEGQPIKDLASKQKTTPTNLSVRLHRARHSLKKKVLETCGSCASHGCVDCSCRPPV